VADDTNNLPASGWYADPRVPKQLRWWDGEGWTNNVYMPDPRTAAPAAETLSQGIFEPEGEKWEWPGAKIG
jgi:hypothetical protein